MTRLDFRIDWGYQFVYSRRHYHPAYCWDGELTCEGGHIDKLFQLEYPYTWWGPVHSARETELPDLSWHSTTRRGMAGIRVIASCDASAVFTLKTAQGTFRFPAAEVLQHGRIVFPVGWKYSHCTVIVTRSAHFWYRLPTRPGEIVVEAEQMEPEPPDSAPLVSFSRMPQRWIRPGASVRAVVNVPDVTAPETETHWLLHLQAMTAVMPDDPYQLARDAMPIEIRSDDVTLLQLHPFFRYHDGAEQILHDVWGEIPGGVLAPGEHTIVIANGHASLPLLVHRATMRPKIRRHLDIEAPRWAIRGEPFIVRVRTLKPCSLKAEESPLLQPVEPLPSGEQPAGMHEFRFVPLGEAVNLRLTFSDEAHSNTALIPAVYNIAPETPHVQVGYDMTTVPHDDTGAMDQILEYTHRTQLGNLVCFRPFPMRTTVLPYLLERWGAYCREHRIHVQCINLLPGPMVAAGGEFFDAAGDHELSWATYLPDPENLCTSMKESAEAYVGYIAARVNELRKDTPRVAFGDGSGGHRYSFLAGVDFLRAETMVANTMHHLSQARAAANTLGSGIWGVHIAIQHPKQPYLESHLSQYVLSLYQAWMMGARFLYEEDSLFVMFKEERQCWDDLLTKGKREITREFYRFAATHPRSFSESQHGPELRIAHVLGRYAAPFNGFICGCEQDPAYSVWGRFGRSEPAWGHLQPEKSQQVIDVLMPGASTHPLRQRYDRRRFFFSGTPYGDFDQVPIEATTDQLATYRLLLLLGWHTMGEEDYAKLKAAVARGATLLLAVPQLSTHTRREFLTTMEDLALFRNGEVSDLTGVRVLGRGVRYCGHWAHTGPGFENARSPALSRVPSVAPDEDGPCYLADIELHGATPIIIDAISGKPMLVEHRLGMGRVYLMTTWAYPGHEELSDFAGAVVAHLAERALGEYRVSDVSQEVFWTWWPGTIPSTGQLMLLNTDWTARGNSKRVTVNAPGLQFDVEVREGTPLIITCLPLCALVPESPEAHVEIVKAAEESAILKVHAVGPQKFAVHTSRRLSIEGADYDGMHLVCRPGATCTSMVIKAVSCAQTPQGTD